MDAYTSCKRCGEVEIAEHLFFTCPFARRVWELLPVNRLPSLNGTWTVKELLVEARKAITLPPVGVSLTPLYPWLLWFLWKARNLLIFENRLSSEEDTVLRAVKEATAWQEAKALSPLKPTSSKREARSPAHKDALWCFSDAAWKAESSCCGLGWIIKDPAKKVIHQGSSSRPFVSSALVAESLALKAAISAALALGVSRVACFSDCQELMLLLNAEGHANEIDGILEDIKLLILNFLSVSFHFIPRVENSEADLLAKSALLPCSSSFCLGV
ncbi:unnamed protein product [Arabidopsis arenosa]|uniref:RNase H type-1 domain-containing protein n=1 Tax=Arabidopsis arenosa TaxID=38785 RepID=A0A8S2AGU8_ARAAE|nr:unnamed protein product [Arabidopsis arenosa]